MQRREDFDVLGIWPTRLGLDRAEYLREPLTKKGVLFLADQAPSMIAGALSGAAAAIVTILLT
jgi:hypothetical protein